MHLSKGVAIAEAVPLLDRSICDSCTARVFLECPPPPAPEPEQEADEQSVTEKADA